ncbi:hypothetical protein GGX14DRAFT_392445 [Mycena pura]|uniref:Peptidase A2 domain-containing protein n=1 Tax=Mycena pura TaxID=153505 RepID=A0AAD6VKP5_9AGAR|nr:hypothetical protein GGX14DRAFT_392445 [Mycena pura]
MDGPTSVRVKQEAADNTPIPEPVPVDPIDMRIDFSREDAIMEDVAPTGAERVLKANQGPPKILKKPGPRQSAVSAHINPQDVLNTILNTPVTLPAGTILAVSSGISNALVEVLKLKNAPRPATTASVTVDSSENEMPASKPSMNIVGATFVTKDRQRLIQIQVDINGKTVNAIVDTGSMLNVVSRSAWRTFMTHISMDITKHITMGDANGGQSQLRGFLRDVLLTMGGVESKASFWVGEKAPFDVLLGRPWQRGNFVSIDERRDGTYLVFRDPDSGINRYELLVDDADDMPINSANLVKNRNIPMPGSFMTRIINSPFEIIADEENEDNICSEDQYNPESVSDLEREIFGTGFSDSEEEPDSKDMNTTNKCAPGTHAEPSTAQSSKGSIAPISQSPICKTCKVLLHERVFEGVGDWKGDLYPFSIEANWVLKAQQKEKDPCVQDVTIHTFYTGFQNLSPWEFYGAKANSPEAQSAAQLINGLKNDPKTVACAQESPYLRTRQQQCEIQGFLHMHTELLYLASKIHMVPSAFLRRISNLIRAHNTGSGSDGNMEGYSEEDLSEQKELGCPPKIQVLGTNPIRFLMETIAPMESIICINQGKTLGGSEEEFILHQKKIIKLVLAEKPEATPSANSQDIPPIQTVHPLLHTINLNPQLRLLDTGQSLPFSTAHSASFLMPQPVAMTQLLFSLISLPTDEPKDESVPPFTPHEDMYSEIREILGPGEGQYHTLLFPNADSSLLCHSSAPQTAVLNELVKCVAYYLLFIDAHVNVPARTPALYWPVHTCLSQSTSALAACCMP